MRRDKTTGQFTRAATLAAGPSPAKLRAALDAALTAASARALAAALTRWRAATADDAIEDERARLQSSATYQ